jgi:hypothetical protein
VYTALHVGWLHGCAFWRFNLGDQTRLGIKVRAKNRSAGQRRGQDVHARVVERDARICTEVDRLRHKYPPTPSHSTHWLARAIARTLDEPLGTIRGRLAALGLR